jgi:hypothetical protein
MNLIIVLAGWHPVIAGIMIDRRIVPLAPKKPDALRDTHLSRVLVTD